MGEDRHRGPTQVGVLRRPISTQEKPDFHGRRFGHRLTPRRKRLIEEMLPGLNIELPASGGKLDLVRLFGGARAAYWLEIGFGAGEHLAAQAAANPETGLVGCEPFVNGVAALLARIDDSGLRNVRIYPEDARRLLPALPDAAFERVFLLFPDPWPKARHNKRRFVNAANLGELARIMTDGAELRFASDHMGYVRWTLEAAYRHPDFRWIAAGPADWRERPADAVETRYEAKARSEGRGPAYLTFARNPR